jgi:2-methylcitrate dehydratase
MIGPANGGCKLVETFFGRLAATTNGIDSADLPRDVVEEARRRILDTVGCMLGGVDQHAVKAVYRAIGEGSGQATLVGDHRRASVAHAALANCTAARYLDYMDSHPGPCSCHPGLVIPPVLAVAEWIDASGVDVIRAIVLGYELDIRLQLGIGDPDIGAHGWSGSTNLGLAVPYSLGGLLGLSTVELAHALAISADHAPTLAASAYGQMAESKASVDGVVAMTAVTSTLMASRGLEGPVDGFSVADGFGQVVARHWDEDLLLAPLDRFRILDVNTKRFNTVKRARAAVAAAIALRDDLPSSWRDIERVTVRLAEADSSKEQDNATVHRRPQNRHTANHSAFFSVAAALVDGDLRPAQFEPERLADPDIIGMIDRIEIVSDRELTGYWPAANPATVEITLASGEVRTHTQIYAPGHPRNPVTDRQLEDKFRGLVGSTRTEPDMDRIVELIGQFEKLPSIRPLMTLLGGRPDAATAPRSPGT